MNVILEMVRSWSKTQGCLNSMECLEKWIKDLNQNTHVNIKECSINDSTFWFYDDYRGEILNRKRSFFSIKGIRLFEDEHFVKEQPIIIQPEIGYLGIICKMFDGILHFLMQAKIEPGNINCVQISPTIQATKSNFTRAHGGRLPLYFEYFENSDRYRVVYDQIQSEQGARFYKKRNRNMILLIDEDIEVHRNYQWMTLGQIKKLMEVDNLVNMDTRTVLSGIPFSIAQFNQEILFEMNEFFDDKPLFESIFHGNQQELLPKIYQQINNYKMFREVVQTTVPINQLVDWEIDEYGITCNKEADFSVRFYEIEISGREVQHWTQPLFKAMGVAIFGLLTRVVDGKREFLVRIKPEIGLCDKIEIGPTIQWETSHKASCDDSVEKVFRKYLENEKETLVDVVLSEEGGRFYHEQNRNVMMEVDEIDISKIENELDYFWVDFATLNYLTQVNNCLNIQLRNLLSLIKL